MAKTQRAVALALALLFLGTSVAFTVVVLFQMRNDNKDAASTNQPEQANVTTPTETEGPKLEGTKLQGFTPIAKIDKLETIDLTPGNGEEVKPGATVTAHYTGALAKDGTIFQSSHDAGQPVPFGLDQVIKGWTDGVPGMKVGGKRRLLIPASLAYGAQERPGIPANSDLVFDIEIVSVEQ